MLAMKPHYEELHEKYGPTMRTADVAQVLHMHPSHVRALCQQGDLPCVRIGARWVVPTARLAAMLDGEDDVR